MSSVPAPSPAGPAPKIIQWLLDTRPLWREANNTADLETVASRALSLLPPTERASVLRYLHLRDAKMALASHLLKRAVISLFAGVAWPDATATPNAKRKPVFRLSGREPVAFNVSHQAGMVALVAVAGYEDGVVDVGVDVVSPTERRDRDLKMIREDGGGGLRQGWAQFVQMHEDVFADEEAAYLKSEGLLEGKGGEEALDYRIRCFYTLWCLREAYIKMTGDALLAEWLKALSFRKFQPPRGGGGVVERFDVWFEGERVEDARMCLRAVGDDYMVCTAFRTPGRPGVALGWELGGFEAPRIEDILERAESTMR